MKYVGFDIEIAKEVPEGINWKEIRPLGITCASLVSDTFTEPFWGGKSEGRHDPQMSVKEVQDMVMIMKQLEAKYKIVTWNGLSFDFDVLAEESQMQEECVEMALNHIDMMFQFFCLKGFPVSINTVAKGCGIPGKIEGMHGDLAPVMWKNGQYQEVIGYNIQDSRMTLDIANYIDKNSYLYWITKANLKKSMVMGALKSVNLLEDYVLPDQSWMTKPLTKEDYLGWTRQVIKRSD